MAITVNQQLESRGDLPSRYGEVLFVEQSSDTTAVATAEDAVTRARESSIRKYDNDTRVDVNESTAIKTALSTYFAANDFPAPALVATQIIAERPSILLTKDLVPSDVAGLGNSVALSFNGADFTVDLSSANSVSTIGSTLATALNKIDGVQGVTSAADGDQLILTFPADTDVGTGFAIPDAATGALPLNRGDLAAYAERTVVPETAELFTGRIVASDRSPRQVVLVGANASATSTETFETAINRIQGFATYGQSAGVTVNVLITDADNPGAEAEGNLLYDLNQIGVGKNAISAFYSGNGDPKHAAYAAVFAGINFTLSNQHRNGAGRDLQGVNADNISDSLQEALTAQNCNFYLRENNFTEVVNGTNIGEWSDVVYVSNWLEREVGNVVRQARKDAQSLTIDEEGNSIIYAALNALFERFNAGGFVQRNGEVNAEQKQNITLLTQSNFDGTLPPGYLTLIGEATRDDRLARKFAPVYYWVVYRASANDITINGFFQQ